MRRTLMLAFVLAVVLASSVSCSRPDDAATVRAPMPVPVDVWADTGALVRLRIVPPDTLPVVAPAAVWMARVSPARLPIEAPLPEPAPEAPEGALDSAPPPLTVDENLKVPIPRGAAPLELPRGRFGIVEVDVRVDEFGAVSDALWAAGSSDSLLVQAALACALAMRFYPALLDGRPVAVWCRQRFDFGRVR